jgi:hypothetical protein
MFPRTKTKRLVFIPDIVFVPERYSTPSQLTSGLPTARSSDSLLKTDWRFAIARASCARPMFPSNTDTLADTAAGRGIKK